MYLRMVWGLNWRLHGGHWAWKGSQCSAAPSLSTKDVIDYWVLFLMVFFYCCYVRSFCCSSGKVAGPSTMPAMNWGKDAVGSPRFVCGKDLIVLFCIPLLCGHNLDFFCILLESAQLERGVIEFLFPSSSDKWVLLRFSVRNRLNSNLSLWKLRKGFPESWSNVVCVTKASRLLKYKPMCKCFRYRNWKQNR